MKITGSSNVEYIEVDGQDYERTEHGTWSVRMGESIEPVYDQAELEEEYAKIKPPKRFFRPFDFTDAMRVIDQGWNVWAAKEHNRKWSRRIEGTPIRNDLTCSIAHAIIEANQPTKDASNDSVQ